MLNKQIKLKTAIIIAILTFIFGVGLQLWAAKADATSWGLLYQVLGIIKNQYVEKNVEDKKLIYGSIKGMLKSLDDPYSRFVEPEGFKEMQIRLEGNFHGVGIQIGMKDNVLTVIAPIEDTPADKAGIKEGDKIIEIDGKSTEDLSLEEAVSMIRGPKGSKVKLTILREPKSKRKEFVLVRDVIKLKAVYKKKMMDEAAKIGYIQLSTFESKDAFDEMERALTELDKKGQKGLILDLRNNGGGLLDNAIQIGSIFLKDGAIVHTVDRYGNRETFEVIDVPYKWQTKPIVVLVNGGSASASEILAGALVDNKRAKIIGTATFGKACVQNIRPLSDGSAVLITVQKYLTPNGRDINKVGISPNITVVIPTASVEEMMKPDYQYSEEKDPQLQTALKEMRKILR